MRGWVRFGFLLLAITGNASAGYNEGVAAAQRCDYAAASREFSEAAKQGDTDAQVSLLFIGGVGSDEEFLKRLRQAVAANNAGAKYWLAFLIEQTADHPDPTELRKLIRESAEGGYTLAMAPLGSLYAERLGPSFDPVLAYAWTNLALRRAEQNPKALPNGNDRRWSIQRALDETTRLLSTEEVARAKDLTDELDRQTPRSKLVIPEPCPHGPPPTLPASTVPEVPPAVGDSATRAAAAYAIVDLGTLGGRDSWGYAINDIGEVTGRSWLSGDRGSWTRAFIYSPGSGMKGIQTEGSSDESHNNVTYGYAINNSGSITGGGSMMGEWSGGHAILYQRARGMEDIGALGSVGYAINSRGQVTGQSINSPANGPRAFIYTPGNGMEDLGGGVAYGINDKGQVTGWSYYVGPEAGPGLGKRAVRHAFVYIPGTGMKDIGPQGGESSEGHAINDAGEIAGVFRPKASLPHAFVYIPDRGFEDLGTLDGRSAEAWAINNATQIVGNSGGRAFLYSRSGGMIDLNRTLPDGSGWVLTDARGINNRGQITGWGIINGATHAYVVSPISP